MGKEEGEALDEYDLKQLPGVDEEVEKRLKEKGYISLWEVAFEAYETFALDAGVTEDAAEKIIANANMVLGLEEDEVE